MFSTTRLLFFAAFCLVLALSLPAMAQSTGQQAEVQVSEADLEKAATAYKKVNEIGQKFQQTLQETQDTSAQQDLQQQANEEMVQAVEDSGFEVQEYNDIMAAIRADEQLSQEFMNKLQ